ncbi:MAG TPA: ribosome recycling factor [Synergistaceae bacterium]|nr:ribosome recycling factor [Synergistaceae bacterium]HPQ36977.1 ribosome recycling factor [Synergistaceae bacterium]
MPKNEMQNLKERMSKAVEHLKKECLGVRTGRAHPALVEDLKVDYYGTMTPLKQMGTVSIPEPRQILISPWDKTSLKAIEKAIMASSLGVTPQTDGENVRINLPELTGERRMELTKLVKKYAEEARVAVRNVRREGNEAFKKMEKTSEITEDDLQLYQKEIQELTDEWIKNVDEVLEKKEKEILED